MSVEKKKEKKDDAGSDKQAGTVKPQQYTVPNKNPFEDDPAFSKNKPSTDVDSSTGTVKTRDSNFDVASGTSTAKAQEDTTQQKDNTTSKKQQPELRQGLPSTPELKQGSPSTTKERGDTGNQGHDDAENESVIEKMRRQAEEQRRQEEERAKAEAEGE